ncbi:hypothetical protein Patl1_20866 [Pistacia atlantica]|uniref:Uncharacterized protein n=1 Tax=Pistacia atlantica TaxID=434234 RepID=A0ACC1BNS1_9ROSI|nr:hypothetical protein Patl1_20866 [Pistacia atlantica]
MLVSSQSLTSKLVSGNLASILEEKKSFAFLISITNGQFFPLVLRLPLPFSRKP